MNKEEKQLLLKDLCSRLPYGVKITDGLHVTMLTVRIDTAPATLAQFISSENLKYYLRPLSSMTEEELKELLSYAGLKEHEIELCKYGGGAELEFWLNEVPCKCISKAIDWLNQKMFDYRGLIPMGLALPAKEGMYN